jgi:hypothetical protein
MRSDRLKTDVTWCTSARQSSPLPTGPANIAGSDVLPVTIVRHLDVLIDLDLGAASHVRMTVSRRFSTSRHLHQLRRYVSDDCFRSLVVALAHSRLDYGNFVLVGSPSYRPRYLQ